MINKNHNYQCTQWLASEVTTEGMQIPSLMVRSPPWPNFSGLHWWLAAFQKATRSCWVSPTQMSPRHASMAPHPLVFSALVLELITQHLLNNFIFRWLCNASESRNVCQEGTGLQLCIVTAVCIWNGNWSGPGQHWFHKLVDIFDYCWNVSIHCASWHGEIWTKSRQKLSNHNESLCHTQDLLVIMLNHWVMNYR